MNEKVLKPKNGIVMLLVNLALIIASIIMFIVSIANIEGSRTFGGFGIILSIPLFIGSLIALAGFKVLQPSEALVLTLFGEYTGTIKKQGFYYVNPFSVAVNPAEKTRLGQSGDVETKKNVINLSAEGQQITIPSGKKISLKIMTLNNSKQKINDALGNPIEVGVAVMWRVVDTAKAVFNVDNFKEYLSLQVDAAVRNIVQIYPYDVATNVDTTGDGIPDEGSLRGSTGIVVKRIKEDIQRRVEEAGLEIVEARITYLAYAPEIAAVMLQRQQATAIVDARMMIVDGAVGMVEMALEKLEANAAIQLSDEQRANMVSNLLVVLVGNRDVQPVVQSSNI